MEIIQIVSRLPPAIDGVGDYAYLLAQQLRAAHGINTQFVVCDPEWGKTEKLPGEAARWNTERVARAKDFTGQGKQTSDLRLDGFPVHQLRERSAGELLRVLSLPGMPTTVLLHYVGYGYGKRGYPLWLVKGLEAWSKERGAESLSSVVRCPSSGHRLLTMFHELYANGPIWRSSFWTSLLQKWIAKSLARRSEHCFTNRAASAIWLSAASLHPVDAIPVLPVFSNLGEPESMLPLVLRKPQMLIYGGLSRSPNDRDLAIKAIRQACNRLGIERLVAFGSTALDSASVGFPVKNIGLLTGSGASKLLSESRVGYLDYFDGYLAKSGIFAAYCAYGLVPLLLRKNDSDADALKMGRHFWVASALPEGAGVEVQQRIADQAREWYAGHSVKETSRIFAAKLKPVADHVDFPVEK